MLLRLSPSAKTGTDIKDEHQAGEASLRISELEYALALAVVV
jgi:hypothetical protein